MDPISMMAIGTAASVAAGGVTAFGQASEGEAKAGSLGYQAQVARLNAGVARTNRDQTLTAGAAKAENAGIMARQRMGQIITAQGASGLDINGASATAVRDSQQRAGAKDQSAIYDNTARQAYGFEVEASNKELSAKMLDADAKSAKTAGYLKAAGTILGTASSVSGKWYDAKNNGVFNGRPTPISDWTSTGYNDA